MLDTNPITNPGSDGLGVFGKYSAKKKFGGKDVLELMKMIGGQGGEEDEEDYVNSSMRAPSTSPMRKSPAYDPNTLYGGAYKMYGGRRFRGGLLGE
jgi:hypothetical protein